MAGRLKQNRARSQRGFYFQTKKRDKELNQKSLSERAQVSSQP